MATEWQVDEMTIPQAARAVEGASREGQAQFARLQDDANIIVFSILADKSTYCGGVRIQDTAIGRRRRLKVTVTDDASTPPPKPGGIAGLFAKKAKYESRPEVVEQVVATLQSVLKPF